MIRWLVEGENKKLELGVSGCVSDLKVWKVVGISWKVGNRGGYGSGMFEGDKHVRFELFCAFTVLV